MAGKERAPQVGEWLARCGGGEMSLRGGSAVAADLGRPPSRPRSSASRGPSSRPGSGGGGGGPDGCLDAVESQHRPLSTSRGGSRLSGGGGMLSRRPLLAGVGDQVLWRPPAQQSGAEASSAARPAAAPSAPRSHSATAAMVAGAVASGRAVTAGPAVSPAAAAATTGAGETGDSKSTEEAALIASLTARLAHVERLNRQQASKLARQTEEVASLRGELRGLRETVAEAVAGLGEEAHSDMPIDSIQRELRALRLERDHYQEQAEQMTAFLADYGLTWIGDHASSDAGSEPTDNTAVATRAPGASCPSSPERSPGATLAALGVDLATIVASVESLNATVERAGARIVSQRGASGAIQARFVDAAPLPLTCFRDGLKLSGREFQAYSCRKGHQLVRDLVDGFFPYDLKDDFPDGVAMKVHDRTALTYEEWLRDAAAADRLLIDDAGIGSGNRPGDGGDHVAGAQACAAKEAAAEVSLLAPSRQPKSATARVLVKCEDGRRAVFCMETWQTIGDLEAALRRWRGESERSSAAPAAGARPLLRTAFPPKSYADPSQTLADAGLTPTATVFAGCADAGGSCAGAGAPA